MEIAGLGIGVGLFLLFAFALTVFWLWMLIEVITKEPDQGNEKLTWILILVLLGQLGAILYFFIRRPQRITQTGQ